MSKRLKTDHVNSVDIIPPRPKEEYTIDVLNPHCFANIFRYLSIQDKLNIEKVSEKCKDSSRFAWCDTKKLDFVTNPFHYEPIDQPTVRQILKRFGQYLRELSIGMLYDCRILTAVSNNCHNLVKLKLEFSRNSTKQFSWKEDTFSRMINLKSIELLNCNITDSLALSSLPDGIEKLKIHKYVNGRTTLSTTSHPQNDLATNILRWTNLKSLVFENWEIDNNVMSSITQRQTLFTHLSFTNCDFFIHKNSGEKLPILDNLHNLEYLNLDSVCRMPEDSLIAIVNNCEKLTHLNLNNSHKRASLPMPISNLQIGNLKNLEYLNMAGQEMVNDTVINSIVINCKELKYLNISNCTKITKQALKKLAYLKNLKELLMNKTRVDDSIILQLNNMKTVECSRNFVTAVGILGILQNSPNIKRLDISSTMLKNDEINNILDIIKKRDNNAELVLVVSNKVRIKFIDLIKTPLFLTLETGLSDNSDIDDEDREAREINRVIRIIDSLQKKSDRGALRQRRAIGNDSD